MGAAEGDVDGAPPERRDNDRGPPTSLLAGLIDMAEPGVAVEEGVGDEGRDNNKGGVEGRGGSSGEEVRSVEEERQLSDVSERQSSLSGVRKGVCCCGVVFCSATGGSGDMGPEILTRATQIGTYNQCCGAGVLGRSR